MPLKAIRTLRRAAALTLLAAAAMLPWGCNTTGCYDNQSSIPLAEFMSGQGEKIAVSGLEIHGVGAPNDSLLAGGEGSNLSEVYLPMRSTHDNTTWCFHYTQEGLDDPALNDTISFGYDSEPYFASEECGAMYRYRIRKVIHTTHLVDSVVILDSLITNADIVTIQIYFHTADEQPDEQPEE